MLKESSIHTTMGGVCLAVGKASTVAPTYQTRHADDAGSALGATDATLWLCLTLLYSL